MAFEIYLLNLLQFAKKTSVGTEKEIATTINTCAPSDSRLTTMLYIPLTVVYMAFILIRVCRGEVRLSQKTLVDWAILYLFATILQMYDMGLLGLIVLVTAVGIQKNRLVHHFLPIEDKAVLVTGCDRGIGHELAKQLDQLGFHVIAGCLFMGGAGERELVESCSDRLKTVKLDVTDAKQVEEAVTLVRKQLENKQLWGIVNNAGICFIGNIETMPNEDIQKIMAVNFFGPVNVCKSFLPLLRRGKGRLVNVASNSGLAPVPLMGVYCASKSALATMSEVLRYELKAWGIHVSTIVPSGYRTGILAYDKSATAERWWNNASDIVREDYGKECFTPQFKLKDHTKVTSPDLSPIVNTIIDALLSKSPKSCYYKGFLARSLPFLYLHLPTILGDLSMKVLGDWFDFQPKALRT